MSAAPIRFYFDFISPFGYFAALRIEELAARHNRTVDWNPFLLGITVIKVMGLRPVMETPLKSDYLERDVSRYARKHGVSFERGLRGQIDPSLYAARAHCWVKHHYPDRQAEMGLALYEAYWGRARPLGSPEEILAEAGLPDGVDQAAFLEGMTNGEASALLRSSVDSAIAAGVFGSPTVVVDGEPFWGADRFEDVDEWLRTGGW